MSESNLVFMATVEQPRVSVAIPTYRRPDLLLDAVRSALAQTYHKPFEVVVVDNGGFPETADALRTIQDPRLSYYINSSNLGMIGNWNQCVKLSRAPYVSILHDDDELAPGFLDGFDRFYSPHYSAYVAGFCAGSTRPEIWPKGDGSTVVYAGDLMISNLTCFPGVVFERSLHERLAGFNPERYPTSDYDFWVRLLQAKPAIRHFAVLAFYRRSPGQETATAFDSIIKASRRVSEGAAASTGMPAFLAAPFVAYANRALAANMRSMYGGKGNSSNHLSARLESAFYRRAWTALRFIYQRDRRAGVDSSQPSLGAARAAGSPPA
jgi:glycosyltransferase